MIVINLKGLKIKQKPIKVDWMSTLGAGLGLGLGTEYPLGIGRNRLKISRVPGIVKK